MGFVLGVSSRGQGRLDLGGTAGAATWGSLTPAITAEVEFKSDGLGVSCLNDRCGSKGGPMVAV